MKKTAAVASALLTLGLLLAGCSAPSAPPQEDEVAQSMAYPKTFGDISYVVAGSWTETACEAQVVYDTGNGTITIASGSTSDSKQLVQDALAQQQIDTHMVEFSGDAEEVEAAGATGTKQAIQANGTEGTVFVFPVKDTTYCIVALYSDTSDQAQAREAADTLFNSVTFGG